MTEDEVAIWEDSYREDGDVYRLDVTDEKKLDEYDDEFVTAFILNNQTSAVEESALNSRLPHSPVRTLHSLKMFRWKCSDSRWALNFQPLKRD